MEGQRPILRGTEAHLGDRGGSEVHFRRPRPKGGRAILKWLQAHFEGADAHFESSDVHFGGLDFAPHFGGPRPNLDGWRAILKWAEVQFGWPRGFRGPLWRAKGPF